MPATVANSDVAMSIQTGAISNEKRYYFYMHACQLITLVW